MLGFLFNSINVLVSAQRESPGGECSTTPTKGRRDACIDMVFVDIDLK